MLSLWHFLVSIIVIVIAGVALKVKNSKKKKEMFVKHARSLGYKVYDYPFKLFGFTMYTEYKRQEKKHGDAYHHYKHELSQYDLIVSNLLLTTMVEILNPEIIKQFYIKANEGYYNKGDFAVGHMKNLVGHENLLLSNGQKWKERRKLISSIFNYDFIISQLPKIQEICQKAFIKLQQNYKNSDSSQKFKLDISEPINEVTSNVVLKCFFKSDELNFIAQQKTVDFINQLLKDIVQAARTKIGVLFGNIISKFGLTAESRRINQQIRKFREEAKKIVQNRLSQIERQKNASDDKKPSDIIDALLKIQQRKQISSNVLSTQSSEPIINQFVTFFLAGSETTLSFTRMMIYRLASNPEVMKKLRDQIKSEVKSKNICLQELKNLKYLQKIQKQTLRMDSSVGAIITRLAIKDHYLGSLKIWKGTAVNVRIRGVHYKQSEYSSPFQFNPDRWDDQSLGHTYTYLPFSSGARNCIGQHLALLQNKIFIVKFLKRYKKVQISKQFGEIKMLLGSMYGPQPIETILEKY